MSFVPFSIRQRVKQLVRACALATLITGAANAQTAITAATYSISDAADQTTGGITYRNQRATLTNVSTATQTYSLTGSSANAVYVRRNTDSDGNGTSNQSTDNDNTSTGLYQKENSSSTIVYGTYQSSYQNYLLNYNMFQGSRDAFTNGTSEPTSNIERIDYTWTAGYTVQGTEALSLFSFFSGDDVRIAVFTAVDAQFTPTAYANTGLAITLMSSFGSALTLPADDTVDNYLNTRYVNQGDAMTGTPTTYDESGWSLKGTLIKLSDLGISAGTVIYGYSLMAGDVNPASASNLVNWNNTSVFSANTASTSSQGGIDFIMPGQFALVPEPSTYGAIFMGLIGLIWGALRFQRRRAVV